MPEIHTGPVLLRFLSTTRVFLTGIFLPIVIKLYSYKDGGVRNLQKIDYFCKYFRHQRNMRKYDLTRKLRSFRPVVKVKYMKNCKAIFNLNRLGCF